ncbi:hypothetical protein ACJJTC_000037 [Scirpophaga incertulas]
MDSSEPHIDEEEHTPTLIEIPTTTHSLPSVVAPTFSSSTAQDHRNETSLEPLNVELHLPERNEVCSTDVESIPVCEETPQIPAENERRYPVRERHEPYRFPENEKGLLYLTSTEPESFKTAMERTIIRKNG